MRPSAWCLVRTTIRWCSRVGNTAFPEEVDAVSYASQNVTEGEKLVGTAQMVAGWIADETGGDVFPIQTAFTYPEAFWDTVTVIEGQEKDHVHPRMAAIPEDMTGYDTVWLVTPIWAYSVCLPVRSFPARQSMFSRRIAAAACPTRWRSCRHCSRTPTCARAWP